MRTAAVVALIVAVSALAETPPVLTAHDKQHETPFALSTPLPRCAGSWTERASCTGDKQPVSGLESRSRAPKTQTTRQASRAGYTRVSVHRRRCSLHRCCPGETQMELCSGWWRSCPQWELSRIQPPPQMVSCWRLRWQVGGQWRNVNSRCRKSSQTTRQDKSSRVHTRGCAPPPM